MFENWLNSVDESGTLTYYPDNLKVEKAQGRLGPVEFVISQIGQSFWTSVDTILRHPTVDEGGFNLYNDAGRRRGGGSVETSKDVLDTIRMRPDATKLTLNFYISGAEIPGDLQPSTQELGFSGALSNPVIETTLDIEGIPPDYNFKVRIHEVVNKDGIRVMSDGGGLDVHHLEHLSSELVPGWDHMDFMERAVQKAAANGTMMISFCKENNILEPIVAFFRNSEILCRRFSMEVTKENMDRFEELIEEDTTGMIEPLSEGWIFRGSSGNWPLKNFEGALGRDPSLKGVQWYEKP